MTDSTDPCTRCGAPYLEGRVCAGSNYTLPCNEPVSTGPVAMTQYVSCEFCGRPKSNTQHTPPVCPGIHTCRDLLFDRAKAAESALAAMTARAEAAEAELKSWLPLIEQANRVRAEARDCGSVGDTATDLLLEAALGDGAGDPPPEPAPAECPQCRSSGAPNRLSGVVGRPLCAHEWHSEPAPQPAAAPKVLPVEELRREIAKAARRASHRGYIRDDGQNALQALAEELERGGEEKGG